MSSVFIQFTFATLLPVIGSVVLFILDREKDFSSRFPMRWQLFVGIIFGVIAILGTELGIETPDAIMNVRDAAPLVAGLVFGAPSGIIAGVIGGVERWLAALWGRGMFTRVACSVATMLAGCYAALLRKFMFDDKRPAWGAATLVSIVNEVLHLTLIFLTNLDQAQRAYHVVRACAFPMVFCNAAAAGLSLFVITIIANERLVPNDEQLPISIVIQRGMLVSVLVAFALTTSFTALLQTSLTNGTVQSLLSLNIDDVKDDISFASDNNLLMLTRRAAALVPSVDDATYEDLEAVRSQFQFSEVSVVNSNGFIVESTDKSIINFNFHTGSQSSEFLRLLNGSAETYVQEYRERTFDGVWRKYAGVTIEGGFLQVGYDASLFQADLSTQVSAAAANRHVGSEGFILVVDEAGSMSGDYFFGIHDADEVEQTRIYLIRRLEGEGPNHLFNITFLGTDCYAMYKHVEGYKIVAMIPASEADFSRNVAVLVGAFMEIIVFALLFLSIYVLLKDNVVDDIHRVNARLAQITEGDLSTKVDVRTSEEFASLSDDINATVDVLKRYISDAEARIDQELSYARAIQTNALPSVFPPYPNHLEFDIFAIMRPAKVVGGDFYDFYLTDENHIAFLVADVSGKSIPGAMFMMRAKTILKSLVDAGMPIDQVFMEGNDVLCSGNDSNMFVTAWMGVMELSTGRVWSVNAGHNRPAVYHVADDVYEYLDLKRGLFLGCMEGMRYTVNEFILEPGDTLFLYTDGVVEANNEEERLYSDNRLLEVLNRYRRCEVRELCEGTLADVDDFAGKAEQFDDITMLALRFNGPHGEARITKASHSLSDTNTTEDIITVEAVVPNVTKVCEFVDERLAKIGCPLKTQFQIDVAIDEVFANICSYAYVDGTGYAWIRYEVLDGGRSVRLTFEDEGIPFNPLLMPEPDITLGIEERKVGGFGIFIVRNTMDEVSYEHRNGRNVLRITKHIS